MELLEIMKRRKSVRRYAAAQIPQEKLDAIVQAGNAAPTSRNLKPCQTFVIRDKATLQKLSAVKKAGAAFVSEADTAIIVVADSQKADTWIEDSAIRLTYLMLAAEAQNVGCCWVQVHLRESAEAVDSEKLVRALLQLPEHMRVVGFLSLGVKAE